MAKTKELPTTSANTLNSLLKGAPRIRALLARSDTLYLGPCIVVCPGAWTRVGPTWRVPSIGYVVAGPTAARWGTAQGLSELATSAGPAPTWHAVALSCTPDPQLIHAIQPAALESAPMALVRALAIEAEEISP